MRGSSRIGTGLFLGLLLVTASGGCNESSGKRNRGRPDAGCAPTVIEVVPATGDVAGGSLVTITTGCFLADFNDDVPEVRFDGSSALVLAVTATTVEVLTPAHPIPESVDISVSTSRSLESAVLVDGFTYTADPSGPCTLTSISPAIGSFQGGETVTLFGSNFALPPQPAPGVLFGAGNPASGVTVVDPSTITAVTPPGTVGVVDVTVVGQNGSCTLPGGFEYADPAGTCSITDVDPAVASTLGGEVVMVTGSGFDVSPPPGVEFGLGNPAPYVLALNAGLLQVVTPPGDLGYVDVIVRNLTGSCYLPGALRYDAPPPPCRLDEITVWKGPEAGGNLIDLLGSGFLDPTLQVFFDSSPAPSWTVMSDTHIRATVPPGTGSTVVSVEVSGMLCPHIRNYFYLECTGNPCNIRRVEPDTGRPGDVVRIPGRYEHITYGVVYFGSVGAQIVERADRYIDVVVPAPSAGASGTVDVQVLGTCGDCCTLIDGFTYLP